MTANPYLEQARSAIQATIVHSRTTFSWFGRESPRLAPRIQRAMTPRTSRNYLLYELQSRLYTDFYLRGAASPRVWGEQTEGESGAAWVETLAAANSGSGSWDNGWEVVTAGAGNALAVRKGGLTLWVTPEDLAASNGDGLAAGGMVQLRLPKDLPNVSPGYYMVLSNRGEGAGEMPPMVRLYWNVRAEGASAIVRTATRLLNDRGLFFRLKVLSDPMAYTRCDAAVIYLHRADYAAAASCLRDVYDGVAHYLKDGIPAFTKPIAPGLGAADDPGPGESFGQHRCRLLADGMIQAQEQGARSIHERLSVVAARYQAEGLSLSHPYLGPASADVFTFGGEHG